MINIFKILILSFLFLSSMYGMDSIKVDKKNQTNKGIAEKIANSGGDSSFIETARIKWSETKSKLENSTRDNNTSQYQKMCSVKENLMFTASNVASALSPIVVLLIVILFILSVKKLFLDSPDSNPGGLTSNVIKGSVFFLLALILTQYNKLIEWWETKLIPDFSDLCLQGEKNALSNIFLETILYIIFVFIQFIGVIIIVMGISELLKKDRTGTINIYGIGTKIIGGILLIQYKYVLAFLGVLKLT